MQDFRIRKTPLVACLLAALSAASVQASAPHERRAGSNAVRNALDAGQLGHRPGKRNAEHVSAISPPFVVTNCDDGGAGSLRDAVASDASLIDLRGLSCSTITLTSGAIHVDHSVEIIGPGRAFAIDGGAADRVIEADAYLTLAYLTLRNGHSDGDGGCLHSSDSVRAYGVEVSNCTAYANGEVAGGAIAVADHLKMVQSVVRESSAYSAGGYSKGGGIRTHSLYLFESTIADNTATSADGQGVGGGIFLDADLEISYSTLSGNEADASGALAMFSDHNRNARVAESTISGNRAKKHVGGLFFDSKVTIDDSTIAFNCAAETSSGYTTGIGLHTRFHAPTLRNTIVANSHFCTTNTTDQPYDFSVHQPDTGVDGDHDLIMLSAVPVPSDTLRADPSLGPLADHGGPTATHAPSADSAVIDVGTAIGWSDQRGLGSARVIGVAADIGAYELRHGITRTVANCEDSGAGSLRDVIAGSRSGDTIDLGTLSCGTITLTTGEIDVLQDSLSLIGPGASALTIDGGQQSRVFYHYGSGTFDLENVTIAHGFLQPILNTANGGCIASKSNVTMKGVTLDSCVAAPPGRSDASGGALFANAATLDSSIVRNSLCGSPDASGGQGGGVDTNGPLTLIRAQIVNNQSIGDYGGFYAGGVTSITDSTITSNSASGTFGAGLARSLFTLTNSTVTHNQSTEYAVGGILVDVFNSTINGNTTSDTRPGYGAGLFAESVIVLQSTLLFGNTSNGIPDDVGGESVTLAGSHNLIGASAWTMPTDTIRTDPMLGPLQDNGGGIMTEALIDGSPAIDHGNNVTGLAFDERGSGFDRDVGPAPDIGAFEVQRGDHDVIFVSNFDERTAKHR
jgi:hypothetical protein